MFTTGSVIGRWTVLSGPHREKRVSDNSTNYIDTYECRCECGTKRRVRYHKLLRNSKSCGCLRRDWQREHSTVHGHNRKGKRTRLYSTWDGMIQRCTNAGHQNYFRYGGRGIFVCIEWFDFATFQRWAEANGYKKTLQLDRMDNDGGYYPENCRWVTEAENKRNTSQTHFIEAFGERKCLTDWALDPRCSVRPGTLIHRIRAQRMSAEDAITRPRATFKSAKPYGGNHG